MCPVIIKQLVKQAFIVPLARSCFSVHCFLSCNIYDLQTNLENLTITDSTGKAIPVKTLLILALKFFQDDFLVMLNKRRQICCVTDISWTIIVPSFWTEAAKQFTMKAVNEVITSSFYNIYMYK